MNGLREDPMNHSPYLLFHQSPEQLRRVGARGGKAQARNRREGLVRANVSSFDPYAPERHEMSCSSHPRTTAGYSIAATPHSHNSTQEAALARLAASSTGSPRPTMESGLRRPAPGGEVLRRENERLRREVERLRRQLSEQAERSLFQSA
jgi:hypothetical protein